MSRKVAIVAVLCLAVFAGFVAPLAGQLNLKPQSTLYKHTTTQIAWQVGSIPLVTVSLSLLIYCRTRLLQPVWQVADSSSHLFHSSLVEALLYSGH
jgi:hypothetical protein